MDQENVQVQACAQQLQETLTISSIPSPTTAIDKEPRNGFIRQKGIKDAKDLDILVLGDCSQSSQKHDQCLLGQPPTSFTQENERTNNSLNESDSSRTYEEHQAASDTTKTSRSNEHNQHVAQSEIGYVGYKSELQMPDIMRLIQKDLSEPYSVYTYRYFIHNWPNLCFLAMSGSECVGAIVCKLDYHKKISKRGYIAMLAVDKNFRKRKIGSTLVKKAIDAMIIDDADEVVLETEITNKPALQLYENLGFVRDKRLFRYYLNGVDALRLKLWLR